MPHVHHPASVVGLLVHQPVAVKHVAGLAVGHVVAVVDVVAVVHHLVELTTVVLPLPDLHPELAAVMRDHSARPEVVKHHSHAPHLIPVAVLSPPEEVLLAHVVVPLIDHPTATVHPAGLAPAQVGGHVGAVAHALIGATAEVAL